MIDSALAGSLVTGGGVAGVFCILFILGVIVPKRVVDDKDRIIAEKDRQIAAKDEQTAQSAASLQAAKDVIASLQQGLIIAGRIPAIPAAGPRMLPEGQGSGEDP